MSTVRPKGTNDFLPADTAKWQRVEGLLRDLAKTYGYEEIRTPIFESTELFLRGVGDTTDIVNKEMYTFEDKGHRSITLRPEATASTARAYIENKMKGLPQPVKLYYMGPMFRYERPQKGRFRQFHQFGIEAFGSVDPAVDAEIIAFTIDFYRRLGLTGLEVRLNSVGCPRCRSTHREKLHAFLAPVTEELCNECRQRYEKNPLRIFDCKNEKCQRLLEGAPTILDCLCDECADHFEKVKTYLNAAEVPFYVDSRLVRGLDYYTKTAFEVILKEIGAQSAICGGGRYDGLIADIGGEPTPGVGVALGMERIFSALEAQGLELPTDAGIDVYYIALNDEARERCFALLQEARIAGLKGEMDYMNRSLKSQMKTADRLDAAYTVIIGEEELEQGEATVRRMDNSEQERVRFDAISDQLIRNRRES